MKESVIQKVLFMKKAFLLSALCIAALFVFALTGSAASPVPTCQKEMTVYKSLHADYENAGLIGGELDPLKINNLAENAVVTDVTSSNPKVARALFTDVIGFENGMEVKYKAIAIYPGVSGKKIRTGSTVISFTVKQNGRSYKLSCRYTLKLKPVPFSMFKVDGKNYVSEMKDYYCINVNVGESAKIKYKFTKEAKNKYKIYYENKNGRRIPVKSGDTIKVSAQEVMALNIEQNAIPEDPWYSPRQVSLVRSPFEVFKVNKKDCAALIGTGWVISANGKKARIKYNLKADVEDLEITYTKPSGETAVVVNNSEINVPKDGLQLQIRYRVADTKKSVEGYVSLSR